MLNFLLFLHVGNDLRQADFSQTCFHRFLCFRQRLFQCALDVAAYETHFLLGIIVDGKRLRRIHRLVNIQQRNVLRVLGEPARPALPVAVSTNPALDNLAKVRRTKLALVFTLSARWPDVTPSLSHPQASPARM